MARPSHRQPSQETPTADRVWPQPPTAVSRDSDSIPRLASATDSRHWAPAPARSCPPHRHDTGRPTRHTCWSSPLIFPTFCPRFMRNQGVFRGARAKTRKPENRWKYKKTRHFWRVLKKWSRGELNPGPVTVPSFFYVRSLLATEGGFSAPINIADNRWRA